MKAEVERELRIRIACAKLFKACPGVEIKACNRGLYDIICTIEGLSFGAKIGSSTESESQQFQNFINYVKNFDYTGSDFRLPVVFIGVNEPSEDARIGFLLSWRMNSPVINKNLTLRKFNQNNWNIIFDNIKAMDQTIRLLSSDNLSVIKRIAINEPDRQGRIHCGEIVYIRRFTNNYKMKPAEVNNEKESFKRYLFGIPESEYPHDRIDDDLFDKVREKYPSAEQKSSPLLVSSELGDLKRSLETLPRRRNITLRLEPNFEQMFQTGITRITCPQLNFNLYYSSKADNQFFYDELLIKTVSVEDWWDAYDYYIKVSDSILKIEE